MPGPPCGALRVTPGPQPRAWRSPAIHPKLILQPMDGIVVRTVYDGDEAAPLSTVILGLAPRTQ